MPGRYGAWLDAVIWSYTGERYGAKVGSHYSDAIKWLSAMRPYRGREDGANPDFYNTVYAITHIVYTLNDYNAYTLSPKWLAEEFRFLKNNLKEAIAEDDPDMMGEFLDTLRAFGLKDSHPVIRKGMDYLRSRTDGRRAITATAHKIARIYYSMLTKGTSYVEAGQQAYEQMYKERRINALKKQAHSLGYQLQPCAS